MSMSLGMPLLKCPSWHVPLDMSLLRWHSLGITFDVSLLTCHFWHVTLNMSLLTCHSWHVTFDKSLLTCHSWRVTLDMSLLRYHSWCATIEASLSTSQSSLIILGFFGLTVVKSTYLELSLAILAFFQLSRAILAISVHLRMSLAILGYLYQYHVSSIRMQVDIGNNMLLPFEKFSWNLFSFFLTRAIPRGARAPKNIAAHLDASFGCLIFLTDYFHKLNFNENVHHGHKNTNFSATDKGIFMKN